MIKAIIAQTKFGLLILDSDNEEFDETFIDSVRVDGFITTNQDLENLEKEPYGLYRCELSWAGEDIYLESYKNTQFVWEEKEECRHEWIGLHGHPAAYECKKCNLVKRYDN